MRAEGDEGSENGGRRRREEEESGEGAWKKGVRRREEGRSERRGRDKEKSFKELEQDGIGKKNV